MAAKYTWPRTYLYGSYTYSRSKRTIEGVNEGNQYYSKYDRPHTLNWLGKYNITPNDQLMFSWSFSSGNPIPIPSARYAVEVNGE